MAISPLTVGVPNTPSGGVRNFTSTRENSADITVGLTGVSASGVIGTLAVALTIGLTGFAGTASAGTLTPDTNVTLTGLAATGTSGTLTPTRSLALTGRRPRAVPARSR